MTEHSQRPESEEQVDRERRESTDLGYRDTEEERAYEQREEQERKESDQSAPGGA